MSQSLLQQKLETWTNTRLLLQYRVMTSTPPQPKINNSASFPCCERCFRVAVLLSDNQMSTWSAMLKTHAELLLRLLGQLVPPTKRPAEAWADVHRHCDGKSCPPLVRLRTLSTRKAVSEEQDVTKKDANAMEGQRLEQDYAPEVV